MLLRLVVVCASLSLVLGDRYYNAISNCRDVTLRNPFAIYGIKVADIPCLKFQQLLSQLSLLPTTTGSPYQSVDVLSYIFINIFVTPAFEGTGQRVLEACTRMSREELYRGFADPLKQQSSMYRDFVTATRGALDPASVKSAIVKTIDFALTHDTQQEVITLTADTLTLQQRGCLEGFGPNANSALASYIIV